MSPGFESQRHHSVICPLTDHHNGFRFGLHQEKVGPVLPFYRKRGFEPDANPSFPQGRPCSQCCQFIRPHHSLFSASLHSFHHLVLIAGPPSLWKETAIATSLKKRHLSGPFPAHLMSCCLHTSHTDVFKLLEDALPSISKMFTCAIPSLENAFLFLISHSLPIIPLSVPLIFVRRQCLWCSPIWQVIWFLRNMSRGGGCLSHPPHFWKRTWEHYLHPIPFTGVRGLCNHLGPLRHLNEGSSLVCQGLLLRE